MPVSIETTPIGSTATDVATNYTGQSLDSGILNGLANGSSTSSLSFSNPSGASTAKVILLLELFDPTAASPVVSLTNGTTQYDLSVSGANSAKRLEWNSIPTSFLSSFQVANSTGVAFPSSGNSLTILPL